LLQGSNIKVVSVQSDGLHVEISVFTGCRRLHTIASCYDIITSPVTTSLPLLCHYYPLRYIMTSEHTKEQTAQFFSNHGYFGLHKDNITIFEQNTLPCLDFNGKILLDQPYRIARSPDGNGGVYAALHHSGVLDDMKRRGVTLVHVYGVDNILVKMADPIFTGFCVEMGADCCAKVVKKAYPTEPVGLLCKCEGKYQVSLNVGSL